MLRPSTSQCHTFLPHFLRLPIPNQVRLSVPIIQMRKPRLREVKQLRDGTVQKRGGVWKPRQLTAVPRSLDSTNVTSLSTDQGRCDPRGIIPHAP